MDAAERGVRAAAIAALGIIGGEAVGLFDVAWATAGNVAAGAAVVSLLMSTVAGSGGDPTTRRPDDRRIHDEHEMAARFGQEHDDASLILARGGWSGLLPRMG
ncbi:holin [Nonomuraea mangrovi]|uniref:Holin n=1 Tax=Nonomuraea mangrovi TaxID=2316207 RepID=A0ABW4T2J1_9ACTN